MNQLIAYYLAATLALATFAVYTAGVLYVGMRLERSRAKRERSQRLARYVAGVEATRVATQAARARQRQPDAATIRRSQA